MLLQLMPSHAHCGATHMRHQALTRLQPLLITFFELHTPFLSFFFLSVHPWCKFHSIHSPAIMVCSNLLGCHLDYVMCQQRALDILLAQIKWEACLIYLDDVITNGAIFSIMLHHLIMIFQMFRSENLKLKLSKCFRYDKVSYLGHLVSAEGVMTDPEKVRAVKEFPRPKTRL